MRHHHTVKTSRLEAFSDGVIAVIITIMVLDLKVPAHLTGLAAVREVLPSLLVYLLSFIQVGIYWVNHHYLLDEVREAGHTLLWSNLIFLFCLSLIPFATVWAHDTGLSPFSISLYAATCLLPAFSYMLLWRAVRQLSSTMPHASLAKQLASLTLYLAAIVSALYHPWIALTCIAAVAVLWLLPPSAAEDTKQDISPTHPHSDAR